MRAVSFILLLIFVLCNELELYSQQFRFEHYVVNDGLPSSTVFDMAQDEKGALWIGTALGLCRYNGKDFVSFGVLDGLPGNSVYKVHPDDKGRLWLATYSGIGFWADGHYTAVPMGEKERLSSFNVSPDGKYYFTSKNKFYIYEDSVARPIDIQKGNAADKMGSYVLHLVDENENFWFGAGKSIARMKDGEMNLIYSEEHASKRQFIRQDNEGRIFLISSRMVREIVDDKLVNPYPGIDKLVRENMDVSSIFIDPEGNWWIGSFRDGLFFISHDKLEEGDFIRYMETEAISSLFQDRDGNLWIGTETSGIFLLSYRAREVLNFRSPGTQIANRISEKYKIGKDGTEWKFANRKLVAKQKKDSVVISNLGNVYSIELASGNDVFVTSSAGLFKIGWEGAKEYRSNYSNFKDQKSKNKEANRLFRKHDEPTRVIWYDSIQDHSYLYTLSGIYKLKDGHFDTIRKNTETYKYIISGITGIAGTDSIWMTSYGHGLFLWNGDSLYQFTTEMGLNSNSLRNTLIEADGSVWVFGSNGVNKISNFDYVNHTGKVFSLYENDGLMMGEVQSGYLRNDTVWLNTNAGISVFPASLITREPFTNPAVEIVSVLINSTDTAILPNYELAYNKNNLEISFSGLAYSDTRKVTYRYKLDGVHDKWNETEYNEVRFPDLSPGVYSFQVKAIDIYDKESSEPAIINFEITPAIWQRAWFRITAFLLPFILITLLVRYRVRSRMKRNQEQLIIQNQLAETEQKALRAQMNPHFIYNVLNSIQQFILKNDTVSALDYLSEFGDLIRRSFENSKHLSIPLTDEVEFLKTYLMLEQMRFDDHINYTIDVDPRIDIDNTFVPSLLIQPFVENSIRHGLKHKPNGGHIQIEFRLEDSSLICSIEDDGIGITKAKELESWKPEEYRSSGMEITRNRLELFNRVSNQEVGMKVFDRSLEGESGTRVELTIPNLGYEDKPAIYGERKTDPLRDRRRRTEKPRISN